MAAPLKIDYAFNAEDLVSSAKIVKFTILKKHQEPDAVQEHEVASFEETMLPHMDAAHNLAKWLLRNEEDAQDVVQEAYLRAFKSFGGFHGSNGRAWLLTIVRNTSYTLLKKNKAVDLTTTFDEEVHADLKQCCLTWMRPTTSPNGCFVTKRMRRMLFKRHICVHLNLSADSMAPTAEPGC